MQNFPKIPKEFLQKYEIINNSILNHNSILSKIQTEIINNSLLNHNSTVSKIQTEIMNNTLLNHYSLMSTIQKEINQNLFLTLEKLSEDFNSINLSKISTLLDWNPPFINVPIIDSRKLLQILNIDDYNKWKINYEITNKKILFIIDLYANYEWIYYDDLEWDETLEHIEDLKNSENPKDEIDRFFLNILDEKEIDFIFNQLKNSPLCKSRIELINELYILFKNKYFFGAVSLISIIIEGIIHDKINNTNQKKIITQLKKETDNIFDEKVISKLGDLFFAKNSNPSSISRNQILHGINYNFGDKITFLKLLMILYNIINIEFKKKTAQ